MGDRVITTQVRIDGDVVPDFSGWELRFKGERFVLPSDNPQASKDNTTRNSVVDLQFQSWVIQELKRYYFFEAASVSAGVAIADKYIAPVKLNVEDFVAMLNQVLQYYFGGKIVADLYLSGTGIYSQEPKIVDINYSYLWDVIGKIFEIYGVRNRIEYNATSDVYTIKINYPAPEISDHDFEYGYQGGLLKFERQVQDESLSNILLGRGGEKNLPYRYFKKADPQNPEWAADPDAIPELANIYFDRLRDINFRWYVRGWMHNPNRDTSGDEAWDPGHVFPTYTISSSSPYYWAYQKGLTDEVFAPVEYVKDDASIEAYGEHWGALDNNDDVYPTIRGLSRAGVGRIDEVVAVSTIVTDDIDAMSKAAALEKSINPLLVSYPRSNNDSPILSENFEIPSGQTGNITYAWVGPTNGTGIHIDTTQSTIVAVDSAGNEHSISGLSAGTYRLKLVISLYVPSGATASGTFGIENIKLTLSAQDADAWKPTFDIWVKDIWNTTREQGETDEAYSERVWGPILGDRAGNEAKIVFSTGFMAASEDYEFVIASYPVPDTSKSIGGVQSAWRITLRKSDAEFDATGLYIPNATTGGKPVAGDKFFFVGIGMPHLYVVMGEEELNTVKSGDLQDSAAVNPTWVISLDKVRVNTLEAGEYGQMLADRLAAGAKLRVTDPRFSGGDVLILHAQSITYTWNEPTDDNPYIVPDIEVVLSDKVVSRESRQDKIESSVEQIRAQYARLDDVEAVVRKVSEPLFLKKTGESDSSASPTQFSSKVSSKGFRQGGVGGTGWGFYRDNTGELADGEIGEGDTVLEVDRMVVRKEMQVNSLVVNQVEYRGGMEVISAAKIEISKVVETPTRYVCYFDQRKNSVANNFQVGDIAYGQVFSPQNVTVRYYKCKVEAVDVDRVELSKTIKDGSGVPQAGDIIVQYGSYTDAARQYVIVRDVVGGGYERMLSGLNAVDATGAEYYFAGRQSGNGPRWFVGGHGTNDDYAEFANGVLTIKANVVFKPGQVIPGLEDYEYLKTALPLDEDATLVSGGLILSKTIALTDANGNILSGINGLPSLSSIAAWYGGPMVDHEAMPSAASYAQSLFRFDGSGYLAGGNIHWDSSGYGGIPGISWSRENDQDVITIDGNVRLASVYGDTVTSILQTIQALPTTYVDFLSNQTITGVKTFTNGIKIGDATLTWHPESSEGAGDGYLEIDRAILTHGDQIVEGGTPGGGGGGGVGYLADLWDVKEGLSPIADDLLVYANNIRLNPDGTIGNGWKNISKGDFMSTYLQLGDAAHLGVATSIGSSVTGLASGALIRSVLGDDFNATWTVKQFINSSIATATATFRGTNTTATTESAFLTWANGLTHDLNDYVFWKTTDSLGNTVYKRYKYDGSQWVFEYELNNSSFTSQQWDAINSGITSGKVGTYDTIAGYFSGGKILSTALPAMYIGKTAAQFTSATQDLTGIGNVTLDNAKYLRAYNSAGDTLYNLAGLNASNYGYLGAANSPRTNIRGKTLYFQSGDSGDTLALYINASQAATFYGTVTLQNNKSIQWKNKPAEGASEINIGLLNLSSSNVLTLGSGLISTGNNARAYNTYLYGGTIYFYTGDTTTGATRKWYINPAGDFIPNDEYRIGSSSKYVKEAYAKKIYLASGISLEYVPASGDTPGYAYLNSTLAVNEAIIGSYTATNAVIQFRNTYGTFKVQAPSSLAAVRIGYGDGPLLVNAAGNVSIESGQGLSLKIKRTTSGGGAYMAFYPGNQDTNYWDIGSSADNVFRFEYKGALLDSISTTGAMTIRSSVYAGLSIKRTATGSSGLKFFPDNQDTHSWDIGSYGNNDNYMFRFTYDGSDKAYFLTDGTLRTAGDQVVTSDIRMKKNLKPIDLKVEDIAKCRAVTFDWTTGGHSFGSIAQDWLPILPEAVKQGDTLGLAYAQLATVGLITVAKHETEQDREIRKLKEKVKGLEEEVKRLRS